MLKTIWKTIRLIVVFFGVLLSAITLMEVLQTYQSLYLLHPVAGYLFVVLILAGLIGLGMFYWKTIGRRPRVLIPPKIEDFQSAHIPSLRRWLRYLQRYLERLAQNPNLSEEQRRQAQCASFAVHESLSACRTQEEMLAVIQKTEESAIRPLLKEIDEKANKYVRNSMRDVMIFVVLSPYKSIDLAVVLYRNVRMVLDVVKMYNSRPTLREQAAIFYDIFTIVAAVNYIHLGRNLLETLGSKIPGVGRFLDEIAQGIGAGFLTTVTGHAAMQRCRAFSGWNPQKAQETMLSHLGDFYADVRDVFFKDVWELLVCKSDQAFAAAKESVAGALEETGRQIAAWLRAPINIAAGTGKSLGGWITKPFRKE
jgi:hypothetical protein